MWRRSSAATRLSRAAPGVRSCLRCSRRCRMRCWRFGSSSWLMACLAADRTAAGVAAVGLGVSAAATWFLRVISDRTQRRFRDQGGIALESHVARLQASVATIEHHERPEYLDRLADAAQPDLRARPHVHVGLLHLRLDPAPRRNLGSTGLHSSSAGVARGFCAADGAHIHLAAGRGACRRKSGARRPIAWRGICSTWPPPLRRAKKYASPKSAIAWCRNAAKPGSAGTARSRSSLGSRRVARVRRGRSSERPTWAPSYSCRRF